jgi:hypothetical protein
MNALITYEGYSAIMSAIMSQIMGGRNNCRIRLFQNNFTPVVTSTWSSFVESTIVGYASLPFPAGVDIGLNPSGVDVWQFSAVTFGPFSPSSQIIYGYWIDWINPLTALRQMLWCHLFDSPFAWVFPGQTMPIVLTPGLNQGPTYVPVILKGDKKHKFLTVG